MTDDSKVTYPLVDANAWRQAWTQQVGPLFKVLRIGLPSKKRVR